MRIETIHRYPIKGLNGDLLVRADLSQGQGLAGDRAFAIARPDTEFDEAAPEHRRKTDFVVLMTHERLAALACRYDPDSGRLVIVDGGTVIAEGNLTEAAERARLGERLARRAGIDPTRGARILHAPGHMFSDVPTKCVSLINLASVAALADRLGRKLDPVRFRANISVSGLPAWSELEWKAGTRLAVGEARLQVLQPIKRCPATDVNPQTAERDVNIPGALVREFGHPYMGVYAEVVEEGTIATGQTVKRIT